jgi:hypothetical protein
LAENGVSASAYASCKKESSADILLRACEPRFSPSSLPANARIIEILKRASVLGVDRRSTRYPRLRAAVANGLAPASVLSAKQPKGKKRKVSNQAVDPVLPEALKRRIEDQTSR